MTQRTCLQCLRALLIAVAVCNVAAPAAHAQQASVFSFLRFNLSARSAALGGATNAVTDDVTAVFLNPATLPTVEGQRVSATFLKHVLDINSGSAVYADHIDGVGTLAASAVFTSYGSFDRTNGAGTRSGTFGASDVAFALSYANEIDTLISYGVTAKFIYSSLDDMAASAVALDAGLLFQIPKSRTNVGISILQLGTQLATYDGTRDRLPVDMRISVNHRLRGLPLLVNASLNHLADDVDSFTDRFLNFSVGGELYLGKAVQLRVGYDNSTRNLSGVNVSTQLTGLSGGVGIVTPKVNVDYAVSSLGAAALLHRVSVGLHL